MAENIFTKEKSVRVYDDKTGAYVRVGPDRDGLDLCEISYNEGKQPMEDEKIIIMPWGMARLLAEAIQDDLP